MAKVIALLSYANCDTLLLFAFGELLRHVQRRHIFGMLTFTMSFFGRL